MIITLILTTFSILAIQKVGNLNNISNINKDKLNLIKQNLEKQSLIIEIGDLECVNNICECQVYLDGIIDKKYEVIQKKCFEMDKVLRRCLNKVEKTDEELRKEIDNQILDDIDNYYDEISKSKVIKAVGGSLELK